MPHTKSHGLVAVVRCPPAWGYTWVGGDLMGVLVLLVLPGAGLVNAGLEAARARQPWHEARGGLSAASSH
jgi:hypothetical protein